VSEGDFEERREREASCPSAAYQTLCIVDTKYVAR
jgi:hypothetical protein